MLSTRPFCVAIPPFKIIFPHARGCLIELKRVFLSLSNASSLLLHGASPCFLYVLPRFTPATSLKQVSVELDGKI